MYNADEEDDYDEEDDQDDGRCGRDDIKTRSTIFTSCRPTAMSIASE